MSQFAGQTGGCLMIAVVMQRNGRAGRGELDGDGPPDATAGASDEDDNVGEVDGHAIAE
jgi:hypothetical protein